MKNMKMKKSVFLSLTVLTVFLLHGCRQDELFSEESTKISNDIQVKKVDYSFIKNKTKVLAGIEKFKTFQTKKESGKFSAQSEGSAVSLAEVLTDNIVLVTDGDYESYTFALQREGDDGSGSTLENLFLVKQPDGSFTAKLITYTDLTEEEKKRLRKGETVEIGERVSIQQVDASPFTAYYDTQVIWIPYMYIVGYTWCSAHEHNNGETFGFGIGHCSADIQSQPIYEIGYIAIGGGGYDGGLGGNYGGGGGSGGGSGSTSLPKSSLLTQPVLPKPEPDEDPNLNFLNNLISKDKKFIYYITSETRKGNSDPKQNSLVNNMDLNFETGYELYDNPNETEYSYFQGENCVAGNHCYALPPAYTSATLGVIHTHTRSKNIFSPEDVGSFAQMYKKSDNKQQVFSIIANGDGLYALMVTDPNKMAEALSATNGDLCNGNYYKTIKLLDREITNAVIRYGDNIYFQIETLNEYLSRWGIGLYFLKNGATQWTQFNDY
jgi:hypothetical protein